LKGISLTEINYVLAVLTVTLCFLPLGIAWKRNLLFGPLLLISIFWAVNGVLYFPELFNWEWYKVYTNVITYAYNLLETCQIILIFYLIFKTAIFKFLIILFIFFEVVIISKLGYTESDVVIIGVGSLISLVLNIGAVIRYILKPEPSNTEHALIFFYVGFTFYFMQFIIIFNFNYLHYYYVTVLAVRVINYLSTCITILIISFGMIKYPVQRKNT
jgi:hypothetical protein